MRIVAGKLRGRRIMAPENRDIRPTSDRVRESLFDILAHRYDGLPEDAIVADIFSGTGALGLEALSRGAAHVTFVDNDRTALDLARRNANELGVAREASFLLRDATKPGPSSRPVDLMFLDAPYRSDLSVPALQALIESGWCRPGALIVIELAKTEDIDLPEGCETVDTRVYGQTKLVFARAPGGEA
jgi:16S rRNA (guanine966-N2)-methyltransferase